jgi:hypothetical protein
MQTAKAILAVLLLTATMWAEDKPLPDAPASQQVTSVTQVPNYAVSWPQKHRKVLIMGTLAGAAAVVTLRALTYRLATPEGEPYSYVTGKPTR